MLAPQTIFFAAVAMLCSAWAALTFFSPPELMDEDEELYFGINAWFWRYGGLALIFAGISTLSYCSSLTPAMSLQADTGASASAPASLHPYPRTFFPEGRNVRRVEALSFIVRPARAGDAP